MKEQKGGKEKEEGRQRKRRVSICSWVILADAKIVECACGGDTWSTTDNLRCGSEDCGRRYGLVSMMRGNEINCEEGACLRPTAAKWPLAAPFY